MTVIPMQIVLTRVVAITVHVVLDIMAMEQSA